MPSPNVTALCTLALSAALLPAQPVGPAPRWVESPSPAPRLAAAFAYDTARDRVVMFGGVPPFGDPLADTWEWDGRAWQRHLPAVAPSGRSGHAMAYDPVRRRVVLFGGNHFDTWEWDGGEWSQRAGTGQFGPGRRTDHHMVWDPVSQSVLLIGGGFWADRDVWSWDGVAWAQHVAPRGLGPVMSRLGGVALDPMRQRLVVLADRETWEWDGAAWLLRSSLSGPAARLDGGMAWDARLQRVALFGGYDPSADQHLNDLWHWDGTAWQEWIGPPGPAPRAGAMTFDARRERYLVFGGRGDFATLLDTAKSDAWAWDMGGWTELYDATHPPSRGDTALAYDTARGRAVLFGGRGPNEVGDTWEWDGQRWFEQRPASAPSPRMGHSLAFDAMRGRTVLFGGGSGSAETWAWDGSTWQLRQPPVSPPGRARSAMVYDAARQRLVLFGGATALGLQNDTWVWDGTTWSELQPLARPTVRALHAMAYDVARDRVVLFGGTFPSARNDTWEFDGTTWLQRAPATTPPARFSHAMAYDARRGRVVLHGGQSPSRLGDTWEWDGTDWSPTAPDRLPRTGHGMAYDTARAQIVVLGGASGSPPYAPGTDLYGGLVNPTSVAVGVGCGVGAPPRLTATRPFLGNPALRAEVADAAESAPFALGVAGQFVTVPLGSSGCSWYLGGPLGFLPGATGPAGFGAIGLALPADPALAGVQVWLQAAVLDLQGPFFRTALTAARELTLGG
ncbi:MAG: kelch repeat-containing protein [Planctomycetota bacterium]